MNAPLHTIDLAGIHGETFDIPAEFKAAVFTAAELMAYLGQDDVSQFWLDHERGLIPRGVLMTCTTSPIRIWLKELVEEWDRCGRPPDLIHAAHEKLIEQKLLDSVNNTLSANPPTLLENN